MSVTRSEHIGTVNDQVRGGTVKVDVQRSARVDGSMRMGPVHVDGVVIRHSIGAEQTTVMLSPAAAQHLADALRRAVTAAQHPQTTTSTAEAT